MAIGTVGRLAFVIGLVAAAGGAGCFLAEAEDSDSAGGRVTEGASTSDILKSTIVLDTGCMAVKVGPRQLLTAARCVQDTTKYAAGRSFTFKVANKVTGDNRVEADDDEAEVDAGDAGVADAGDAGRPANRSNTEATIEKVALNASYTAKCVGNESCAFGAIGASDAKDIAVIVLDAELSSVKTAPIDLDAVGQSDKVIVLGSSCAKFEDQASGGVKTFKTIAVPAKSVNHTGSPYKTEAQFTTRLNGSYTVTPAIGWRTGEPKVCKTDIGAPMFRGGQLAVAGITSNYTKFSADGALVTLHHTRVDTVSKVASWLKSLGVETTHSCSEAQGGCVKNGYDGGAPSPSSTNDTTDPSSDGGTTIKPESDAGDDDEVDGGEGPPASTDLPDHGEEGSVSESNGDDYGSGDEGSGDDDYDAGPKKKKKAASGCSAAPGSMPSGTDGMLFVVGLALAGAIARRRREP